jgi:hypothetical protein
VQILSNAFLSAQSSAIIVWLMLGSFPLGRKMLVGAALFAPSAWVIFALIAQHVGPFRPLFWSAVVLVQMIAMAAMSALLSVLRWRIVLFDEVAASPAGPWLQFSIRHILIATTAAAIFTALAKAVVANSAAGMGWREWLQVAIDGVLLGTLSLVAVWAALGAGSIASRVTQLLLLAVLLAGLLWWSEVAVESLLSPGSNTVWWFKQTFAGAWWIGWTVLAGAFLASWLSVLRVTGYRLVRQRDR